MPDTAGIRTRILLLSDTHAVDSHQPFVPGHAFNPPFAEADLVIHSGDLTTTGTIEEHGHAVELLKSLKAPLKIVIPGNHDLTLDRTWYSDTSKGHRSRKGYPKRPIYTEDQLGQILNLYTGPEAKQHGIVYIEEGVRSLELANGARLTVYASAYTPEFYGWAFAYPVEHDQFGSFDNHVDVVVTHGPPHTILDETVHGEIRAGCPWLLEAVSRSRPLLHCFGHIHEGWGAMKRTWRVDEDSDDDGHHSKVTACQHGDGGGDAALRYTDLKGKQIVDLESSRDDQDERKRQQQIDVVKVDANQMNRDHAAYIDATGIRRRGETLFVNASIMDVAYRPVHGPWLVDVMLRSAVKSHQRL